CCAANSRTPAASWRAALPSWRRRRRLPTTSKGFRRSSASASDALIEALLAAPARLGSVRVLAIDGPSGAGKSTLAARVVAGLTARGCRTTLVSTDAFATWDDPVSWWPKLVD